MLLDLAKLALVQVHIWLGIEVIIDFSYYHLIVVWFPIWICVLAIQLPEVVAAMEEEFQSFVFIVDDSLPSHRCCWYLIEVLKHLMLRYLLLLLGWWLL